MFSALIASIGRQIGFLVDSQTGRGEAIARIAVDGHPSGVAAALDEPSGYSALFAQITFPKEYEVVLEPALK